MSRFYVPKESIRGNIITIRGQEAHHIIDVMRLKKLDKVVTFDGTGREYSGFIKDIKPRLVTVEVIQSRTPFGRETSRITLVQAIPKKDKMDYIVEKSTELGVHSIIPVVTRRTIPDWDESKRSSHVQRWRKLATEASKQCGRADIPQVEDIRPFSDCLEGLGDYDLALIAALDDAAVNLKEAIADFMGGKVIVAIGPEGDFAPDEVEQARKAGFRLVSLGSRVLKSDTAGLAVMAILNYEFSDR